MLPRGVFVDAASSPLAVKTLPRCGQRDPRILDARPHPAQRVEIVHPFAVEQDVALLGKLKFAGDAEAELLQPTDEGSNGSCGHVDWDAIGTQE